MLSENMVESEGADCENPRSAVGVQQPMTCGSLLSVSLMAVSCSNVIAFSSSLLGDQLARLLDHMPQKDLLKSAIVIYLAGQGNYLMDYGLGIPGAFWTS